MPTPPEVTAADRERLREKALCTRWPIVEADDILRLIESYDALQARVAALEGDLALAISAAQSLEPQYRALERLTDELASQRNALQLRVTAQEAALRALSKAWALSWDCSADPGHRIMNAAFEAQAP
jgi:uncharacterized protein involved in exopolysaccharide biosynthesis